MKPKNNLTLSEINQVFYEKDSKLYWKNNKLAGYRRNDNYIHIKYKNCCFYAHRLLYQIYNNFEEIPEGFLVDHKDCDRTNNSKENLRLATPSQNSHNIRLAKNNSTGIKGLTLKTYNNKNETKTVYQASVCVNYKQKYKTFAYNDKGFDSAKKWLEEKRKELHGEYKNEG